MHDGTDHVTQQADPEPGASHGYWMSEGTRLDMAGEPELALAAFQKAAALSPLDVNSASACAALFSMLDCPRDAYRTLASVEAALMCDADGAANLAIAAEGCGDLAKARAAYARALELHPGHLRSLNNLAVLDARMSQWDLAVRMAQLCIDLSPAHAPHHANLAEYLAGARRYGEALEVLAHALKLFPEHVELKLRHIVLMAFTGALDDANAALRTLDPATRTQINNFLLKLETAEGGAVEGAIQGSAADHAADDALQIYTRQVFRNLAISDWRHHALLAGALRDALIDSTAGAADRDWGDVPLHGVVLGMGEEDLREMRLQSMRFRKSRLKPCPPFRPDAHGHRISTGDRLHVGLAIQSFGNLRQVKALARQLAMHDDTRFAVHVYAFGGRPEPLNQDILRRHAASVNELGHMTNLEAVGRMRLDGLDLYVEQAQSCVWSRQEIALMRVAPVQLRQPGHHRHHVAGAWDYLLSDRFVHPGSSDRNQPESQEEFGPLVRLPHSCWLDGSETGPDEVRPSREKAGLPADAVVLCSCVRPLQLGPETFGHWMKILRSLPDAMLWLPFCGRASTNLVREAMAAGVGPQRLIFSTGGDTEALWSQLGHADLILDPMGISDGTSLFAALHAGVPGLSCPGLHMASRMGGSILRAAGLSSCIMPTPAAYVAESVRLGRNPRALRELRHQLLHGLAEAPLFKLQARVREMEAAWQGMVARSRSGLAPQSMDI